MSVVFAQGFSTAGVRAGISAVEGKKDVALVVNNGPLSVAAGVFTTNRFAAAPVQYSRGIIANGTARAVVINSGGANALSANCFPWMQFSMVSMMQPTCSRIPLKQDAMLPRQL